MKYEVIKSNGQVSIGIVDMEWSDLQALLKGSGHIARKYKGDMEDDTVFSTGRIIEMLAKDPKTGTVTVHVLGGNDKATQEQYAVEYIQRRDKLGIVEVDIDPETPLPKYTAQIDPTQPVPSSKPVLGFDGEYRWLSNFWCSKITLNHKKLGELVFSSVECAYQAAKCGKMEDIKQFTRMNSVRAKRAGKTVLIRADWDDMKLQVMESLLRRKFQIPDLRAKLLATGDAYLEETNYWHDNFWGRCSCNKCRSIEWQNNLGKLLMEIRAELKEVN